MRVFSLFLLFALLIACCSAVAMAQEGDASAAAAVVPEQQQQQQQQQQAPPAEVTRVEPPVVQQQQQQSTPTPVAAAPSVDNSAIEAVQRSVEQLASESRSANAATNAKVDSLNQVVSEGLAKLHAADAAHTASSAGSSSAADATAAALKDSQARLSSLEKELRELKTLLSNFVNEQGKLNAAAAAEAAAAKSQAKKPAAADPALAEIAATQKQILSALANATSAWSFDHEALLEMVKSRGMEATTALGRLVNRAVEQAQEHYPTLQKNAVEFGSTLGSQGYEHATLLHGHATSLFEVGQRRLTSLLREQGVPKEYVQPAVWSALGLAVLLALIVTISILKCACRCCCRCCRGGNKGNKRVAAAAGAAGAAAKANKKNKHNRPGSQVVAAEEEEVVAE